MPWGFAGRGGSGLTVTCPRSRRDCACPAIQELSHPEEALQPGPVGHLPGRRGTRGCTRPRHGRNIRGGRDPLCRSVRRRGRLAPESGGCRWMGGPFAAGCGWCGSCRSFIHSIAHSLCTERAGIIGRHEADDRHSCLPRGASRVVGRAAPRHGLDQGSERFTGAPSLSAGGLLEQDQTPYCCR